MTPLCVSYIKAIHQQDPFPCLENTPGPCAPARLLLPVHCRLVLGLQPQASSGLPVSILLPYTPLNPAAATDPFKIPLAPFYSFANIHRTSPAPPEEGNAHRAWSARPCTTVLPSVYTLRLSPSSSPLLVFPAPTTCPPGCSVPTRHIRPQGLSTACPSQWDTLTADCHRLTPAPLSLWSDHPAQEAFPDHLV